MADVPDAPDALPNAGDAHLDQRYYSYGHAASPAAVCIPVRQTTCVNIPQEFQS